MEERGREGMGGGCPQDTILDPPLFTSLLGFVFVFGSTRRSLFALALVFVFFDSLPASSADLFGCRPLPLEALLPFIALSLAFPPDWIYMVNL